jgi:ArsR family transcriptional regulator
MKVAAPITDCCASVLRGPLGQDEAERLAAALKVVADPTRLRLLSLLASHPGGEACVCDLVAPLDLSQPTISHHLKVLHDAGLLARARRGAWVYYRLLPERLQLLRDALGAPAVAPA